MPKNVKKCQAWKSRYASPTPSRGLVVFQVTRTLYQCPCSAYVKWFYLFWLVGAFGFRGSLFVSTISTTATTAKAHSLKKTQKISGNNNDNNDKDVARLKKQNFSVPSDYFLQGLLKFLRAKRKKVLWVCGSCTLSSSHRHNLTTVPGYQVPCIAT